MTVHKIFNPNSDVERLYWPRIKGGRRLIACEDFVRMEENSLCWYMKQSVEPMLKVVERYRIVIIDEAGD